MLIMFLKLFLIVHHLWVLHHQNVQPCSRKTQSAKYHLIKSLKKQDWHKCNMNKMAVRDYNGYF